MPMIPARACAMLPAFLVLACSQAAVPASPSTPDGSEAEVRKAIDAYYRDFSARDWNAFADHFWPGATLATLWQAAEGEPPTVFILTVPEFVARAPEGPGSASIFEERLVSARVEVAGNLAQVWARYEARFGEPGDILEWTGIDAFTLLRHEDAWRITSIAYVPD